MESTLITKVCVDVWIKLTNSYLITTNMLLANLYLGSNSYLGLLGYLPFELLLRILLEACGPYFGSLFEFVRHRADIQLVCRTFDCLVRNNADFWSSYSFEPFVDFDYMQRCIQRFHGRLVDLRLSFKHYHSSDVFSRLRDSLVSSPTSPLETLQIAAQHIHHCRWLHIDAEDVRSLPAIFQLLSSKDASHLVSLTLSRIPISSMLSTLSDIRPPANFLNGTLPGLRFLRLSRMILSWSNLGYYVNLTVLVMHDLPPHLSPSLLVLRAVLGSSPNLVCVSLRRIHVVCDVQTEPPFSLSLPSIRHLDIAFSENEAMALFLSSCELQLLSLRVAFDRPGDIALLMRSSHLLQDIKSFHAAGLINDQSDVVRVVAAMPRLENIDVSWATPSFFLGFSKITDPRFCPNLQSVTTCGVGFEAIRAFVSAREVILRNFTVHHLDTSDIDPKDLKYIRERVTFFEFASKEWSPFDYDWIKPLGRRSRNSI